MRTHEKASLQVTDPPSLVKAASNGAGPYLLALQNDAPEMYANFILANARAWTNEPPSDVYAEMVEQTISIFDAFTSAGPR